MAIGHMHFLSPQYLLLLLFARIHGDLVGGLYHQVLLSLQKVLSDPVRPLCSHYGAVVGLHALGWKVGSLLGRRSTFIIRLAHKGGIVNACRIVVFN